MAHGLMSDPLPQDPWYPRLKTWDELLYEIGHCMNVATDVVFSQVHSAVASRWTCLPLVECIALGEKLSSLCAGHDELCRAVCLSEGQGRLSHFEEVWARHGSVAHSSLTAVPATALESLNDVRGSRRSNELARGHSIMSPEGLAAASSNSLASPGGLAAASSNSLASPGGLAAASSNSLASPGRLAPVSLDNLATLSTTSSKSLVTGFELSDKQFASGCAVTRRLQSSDSIEGSVFQRIESRGRLATPLSGVRVSALENSCLSDKVIPCDVVEPVGPEDICFVSSFSLFEGNAPAPVPEQKYYHGSDCRGSVCGGCVGLGACDSRGVSVECEEFVQCTTQSCDGGVGKCTSAGLSGVCEWGSEYVQNYSDGCDGAADGSGLAEVQDMALDPEYHGGGVSQPPVGSNGERRGSSSNMCGVEGVSSPFAEGRMQPPFDRLGSNPECRVCGFDDKLQQCINGGGGSISQTPLGVCTSFSLLPRASDGHEPLSLQCGKRCLSDVLLCAEGEPGAQCPDVSIRRRRRESRIPPSPGRRWWPPQR